MTEKTEISWDRGYIQVYTGSGKGKTTAALGLAVRAAGAGVKVFIAQFIKGMKYSELEAIGRFSGLITVKQYGRGCFIRGKPAEEDIRAVREGLVEVRKIINSGKYEVVVLDEANIATHFNLFSIDELLTLIDSRPRNVELVITGRYAHPRVIEIADLVTDMHEIKHYYMHGVEARKGIEK